ncbi:MAG: hypothetical protein H6948_02250 [Zoogloeaceae bacterium]|nr:hypothetical protein [Zoogloeaceae bacterium]
MKNWLKALNELGARDIAAALGLGGGAGVLCFVLASAFVDQVTSNIERNARGLEEARLQRERIERRISEMEGHERASAERDASHARRLDRLEQYQDREGSLGRWGHEALRSRNR